METYVDDGRWFFGWKNFKWLVVELRKLGSNENSYFSQKRINTFVAFYIGQLGMLGIYFYMISRPQYLSMGEFLLWAGVEFAVAGYSLDKTQKEKIARIEAEKKL